MASKKRRLEKKTCEIGNRHEVKHRLLTEYGNICWLCKKELPLKQLTIHHIHQFCFTHSTTYEDSMILCQDCHFGTVNHIKYNSEEYWELMDDILEEMDRPKQPH